MEVSHEIYAWLTELNILRAEKTIIMRKEGKVYVDDEIVNNFFNGFYIDKILYDLEKLYNRFYKINLNYTQKLDEIKNLKIDSKNNFNDKNLRTAVWKIVSQVAENFGIELNQEQTRNLSNGNIQTLIYLINSIFSLTRELLKRSPDKNGKSITLIHHF